MNADALDPDLAKFLLTGPASANTRTILQTIGDVYEAGPKRWAQLWTDHEPALRTFAAAHHIAPGRAHRFFAQAIAERLEDKAQRATRLEARVQALERVCDIVRQQVALLETVEALDGEILAIHKQHRVSLPDTSQILTLFVPKWRAALQRSLPKRHTSDAAI